jgi:hypothetical protein
MRDRVQIAHVSGGASAGQFSFEPKLHEAKPATFVSYRPPQLAAVCPNPFSFQPDGRCPARPNASCSRVSKSAPTSRAAFWLTAPIAAYVCICDQPGLVPGFSFGGLLRPVPDGWVLVA